MLAFQSLIFVSFLLLSVICWYAYPLSVCTMHKFYTQTTSFDGVFLLVVFHSFDIICNYCFLSWIIKYVSTCTCTCEVMSGEAGALTAFIFLPKLVESVFKGVGRRCIHVMLWKSQCNAVHMKSSSVKAAAAAPYRAMPCRIRCERALS